MRRFSASFDAAAPVQSRADTTMKQDHKPTRLDTSVLHLLHRSGQQAEILFMRQTGADEMTPRQYAVLLTVEANEDISQTGLVNATGIDRSTLADVVRRLTNRGWLARKRTKHDARMYAVKLTPKGKLALDAARPAAKRADDVVLSTLNAKQRQEFLTTLSQVVSGMDKLAEAA
jgi:MarR family transcriptional regulator, temperature-dependent positive regulator of motility